MTDPIEKLREYGYELPAPKPPVASYVSVARTGNLLYVSGQISSDSNGVVQGLLGDTMNVVQGGNAAELCAVNILAPDSTGAGDILATGFACGWVKEKDPLWALCFGAGALRAALETHEAGLAKIPPMNKIESSASYFYNTVGFKRL